MRYKHLMLNFSKSTLFSLIQNLALLPLNVQTAVIHPKDHQDSWTPVLNWNYQLQIHADHARLTNSSLNTRVDNRDHAPTIGNGNQLKGVVASST